MSLSAAAQTSVSTSALMPLMYLSIQVCAFILAPPGFSFHHSWLMFDQLSHLAVCRTSEGGSYLSNLGFCRPCLLLAQC